MQTIEKTAATMRAALSAESDAMLASGQHPTAAKAIREFLESASDEQLAKLARIIREA